MPPMLMKHDVDPKQEIFDKIGDLSDVTMMNAEVLLGIYFHGGLSGGGKGVKQTTKGILLPDSVVAEDEFQGKVCLVLKAGPLAFVDTDEIHFEHKVRVGDWVVIRASDGWDLSVHGVKCRMVPDVRIKMVVESPDSIW